MLGFAGVVLIVSSQLGGGSGSGERAAGMGLALAAALGWAVGTLAVKELLTRRPDIDAVGLTTGQYLAGGAVLLVISLSPRAATERSGARANSGSPSPSSPSSALHSRPSPTSGRCATSPRRAWSPGVFSRR